MLSAPPISTLPPIDPHNQKATDTTTGTGNTTPLLLLELPTNMMMAEGPPPSKRPRQEEGAIVVAPTNPTPGRSSSLPTPTLRLEGHKGSVYKVLYSPSGDTLCSTSFDKTLLLWGHKLSDDDDDDETSEEQPTTADYRNYNCLQGHKNAVLDATYLDNDALVSCSADKTVMLWDTRTGTRLRKYVEHSGIVNAVSGQTAHQFLSVSDDTTIRLWDTRQKRCSGTFQTDYPVLAVAATSENNFFTSGIDPKLYAWDVRKFTRPIYSMAGHNDTVTCLAMHPDQTHVMSNSMDQSLKSWDIRPFVSNPSKRHDQTFVGHKHGPDRGLLKCCWNADGTLASGGSSDRRLHIWDVVSGEELYDLPGHTGCVNSVAFHPKETTVVASGSSDQTIFVGELS